MNKFALSCAALAALAFAGTANAALIPYTNGNQAATADVTLGAGAVTIKLTNDTATTSSAGDLLTKYTLSLSGLTGGTATSGTAAARREVASNGSFTELTGPFNLLSSGLNTWTANISGDTITLTFNPNAEYALLGVDTAGSYAGANGSIKGNAGHNPFAYGNVIFSFNAAGVTSESEVLGSSVFFGTDFGTKIPDEPGGGVPEPASLGILALGGVALLARRRKAS